MRVSVEALGGMIGRWDTQLQHAALTRLATIGSPADTVFPAVATTLRDGPLPLQAAAATAAASMCRGAACAPEAAASIVASFARGAGGSTSYGDARYVAHISEPTGCWPSKRRWTIHSPACASPLPKR